MHVEDRKRIVEDWFSDLKQETYRSKIRGKTISNDFVTLNRDIGAIWNRNVGVSDLRHRYAEIESNIRVLRADLVI